MNTIDIDTILNRNKLKESIKSVLIDFNQNKDLTKKRGIYIYGNPGTGKTYFIKHILQELNYDVITYDAGDIRNKSVIDTLTKNNMANVNVLSMLTGNNKKIAIIMDEIDGMNNGDKGGINSLIKLIRPKKTKKQKQEEISYNPIICIGNYHVDKKIKELMKICHVFELHNPDDKQMTKLIISLMPNIKDEYKNAILSYIKGDLKKLNWIVDMYNDDLLNNDIIMSLNKKNTFNDDTKSLTKKLLNSQIKFNEHNYNMNETDRTIIGLLWHENVIDILNKIDKYKSIKLYKHILENICFSDYIDRITFQKQIWQFNEMSSLIKTCYNNYIYCNSFLPNQIPKFNPTEVRFTKVLTKYSTEFNNKIFILNMCQKLMMNKNDLFSYFKYLQKTQNIENIYKSLYIYEISKLDVDRMYRYINFVSEEN